MSVSDSLGSVRTLGPLDYRELGSGPPVVFVHGLMVNADLWREVVPGVAAAGYRCLAPDWPLGSHSRPLPPSTDLSPPGVAQMIADFLTGLDLTDVTLVANDTGGALVQLLLATDPSRVGRVVLTSCDALERFFPPQFRFLPLAARTPFFGPLTSRLLRPHWARRLPLAYGLLSHHEIPAWVTDSYVHPLRDRGVQQDLRRFLLGVHPRHTIGAASSLASFHHPVLLPWAEDDRLFPMSLGRRLAALFPDARLVPVSRSRTFVPEDQPALLTELITDFAA
jgi:pimeloyl-ACP methyl ester carboxylesterase